MPTIEINGCRTRYETVGRGPALLMFSPGGFDSSLENWTSFGRYRNLGLIDALSPHYTCVVFDRRESGRSSGRLERLTWEKYVTQAVGLLDHLGIGRAHAMGAASAARVPRRSRSRTPAGWPPWCSSPRPHGYTYRAAQQRRFRHHIGFVLEHGLQAVVDLARGSTAGFSKDPRVGPWAATLRSDDAFAAAYAATDLDRYLTIVSGTCRVLFDRDTVPGVEPEDLSVLEVPTLIVPGEDASHTRSAARYLQECLAVNEYWDVPVAEQTPQACAERVLDFLGRHPV